MDDLRVTMPEIPLRCEASDLMRIFNVKKSRVYALIAAGRFDRFEILPRIGKRAWCGLLIAAYLKGESRPQVEPFRKSRAS